MMNLKNSGGFKRVGYLFLIAVLIGVFLVDLKNDPIQAYGIPISDAKLTTLHGASNQNPQKKNKQNRVLWTNCADQNRGNLTQVADCDGTNDNVTACIYCTEPDRQPYVDTTTTVPANGYSANGKTTCAGAVYLGKCVSGQCVNGVAQAQSCATNNLDKYLQQAPVGGG